MNRGILLLAAFSNGCWLPVEQRVRAVTGSAVRGVTASDAGPVILDTELSGSVLVVRASRTAQCRAEVIETISEREVRQAHLLGTTDRQKWGYALLVAMIVAYPVGLGALVVTVVANLKLRPYDRDLPPRDEVAGVADWPCTLPVRGMTVHARLADGTLFTGLTDEHGRFAVLLPDAAVLTDVRAETVRLATTR